MSGPTGLSVPQYVLKLSTHQTINPLHPLLIARVHDSPVVNLVIFSNSQNSISCLCLPFFLLFLEDGRKHLVFEHHAVPCHAALALEFITVNKLWPAGVNSYHTNYS